MQKQLNAREKNLPNMGNVFQSFQNMYNMIPINDGIRKSKGAIKSSYPTSFNGDSEATLEITDREFDITMLNDCFIQVEGTAQYRVELGTGMGAFDTALESGLGGFEEYNFIFIGFKSAAQVIRQLGLMINDRKDLCDFLNPNNLQETYLYNLCGSEAKRKNKSGIYSLWEDVWEKSNSVCGTYIPMKEVRKNNGDGTFRYKYSIPIDSILAFQAVDMFPSSIMGILKLILNFQFTGAVWCPVSQKIVAEQYAYMGYPIVGEKEDLVLYDEAVSHQFLQANIEYGDIMVLTASNAQIKKTARVSVTSFAVSSLKAHIKGFGIKEEVKQSIYNMMKQAPLLIPAQKLERFTFSTGLLSPGPFDATAAIAMRNVNCISVMFATDVSNTTVFRNPMIRNLQLTIGNTLYPAERTSTMHALNPEYLTYQLQACELDGAITPSKSFVNSIIHDRLLYTIDSAGNVNVTGRYNNTRSDGTDFVFTVETERGQSGYEFDGLTTDGVANVRLTFESVTNNPAHNVYYNYDPVNYPGRVPSAPVLHIARDVFWELGFNEKGEPFMMMNDKTIDPK